jgi:hypothetical protein
MMAVAFETEFRIWADEQAPHSATTAAMVNSRDLLGSFIFDSGVKVLLVGAAPARLWRIGIRDDPTVRKFRPVALI